MIPKTEDKVKVHFHNGQTVEGIVKSWSEKEVVLIVERQDDNIDVIAIIPNPRQDILMITIFGPETKACPPPEDIPIPKKETDLELRNKRLADLHLLKMAVEKEGLAKQMKTHHIDQNRAGFTHVLDPLDFLLGRKTRTAPIPMRNPKGKNERFRKI